MPALGRPLPSLTRPTRTCAKSTQVNYLARAELCRTSIPRMLARGGGHIVNISSMAGCSVLPGLVSYSASKAALTHFTAGLRADLRGLPIGTTLVELGPIPTEMLAQTDDYVPTAAAFPAFLPDASRGRRTTREGGRRGGRGSSDGPEACADPQANGPQFPVVRSASTHYGSDAHRRPPPSQVATAGPEPRCRAEPDTSRAKPDGQRPHARL